MKKNNEQQQKPKRGWFPSTWFSSSKSKAPVQNTEAKAKTKTPANTNTGAAASEKTAGGQPDFFTTLAKTPKRKSVSFAPEVKKTELTQQELEAYRAGKSKYQMSEEDIKKAILRPMLTWETIILKDIDHETSKHKTQIIANCNDFVMQDIRSEAYTDEQIIERNQNQIIFLILSFYYTANSVKNGTDNYLADRLLAADPELKPTQEEFKTLFTIADKSMDLFIRDNFHQKNVLPNIENLNTIIESACRNVIQHKDEILAAKKPKQIKAIKDLIADQMFKELFPKPRSLGR